MLEDAACISMDNLLDILPRVLSKRGLQQHATSALLIVRAKQWYKEQLPDLYDDVAVLSLKDGILIIGCKHSIALQECEQRRGDLIEHLRSESLQSGILTVQFTRM